jgi:CRP-like cAMP-binding protein
MDPESLRIVKHISVKKGYILQREGQLNSKVYIVKKGLLRSYSIDHKGKEHIFMFAPEGWVIAGSNPPEVPSDLFIEALEDSELVVLPKQMEPDQHDYKKLIKRIEVLQKRIILLMSATAIERYEHFRVTYPQIMQRVPQKMIASYLGITPEALSTLKKQLPKRP